MPGPPPDPRSDRELLAAHVAGRDGAFDELVRRYAERLWLLAFRTLDHREDASDAVQDTFVSALRGAARYRGESEVSTWLHRIVVNACLDRIRRRRTRTTEPLAGHDLPTPRDGIDDHLTRLTVAEALATLPDGQRLAVVMVDVHGFSVAETAEILGVREGTIKSRCNRARGRLTGLLGHLQPPQRVRDPVAARGNDGAAGDVQPMSAGDEARGTERTGGGS
ncbi:RNA polymerase sigma factor SigM [Actinomycetospora sp. NBRC 106375]|uniref:RNA polymerase sigma factor SigM n=1 Tax=Actinomycetospora sp. NBRC 106375 TaxID=3032207 RepID=UPI0024A4305B|nr:RNA polymerase sigma factor SigM [Actinomycetospora sp. NBRC 106375]GLZ49127.1 RNA polymerase sigma factor SigM [Actinomycetospora sp. NBRC 106375]